MYRHILKLFYISRRTDEHRAVVMTSTLGTLSIVNLFLPLLRLFHSQKLKKKRDGIVG